MPDKHLSTQFDTDLNVISNNLMRLGGLVESQVSQAIYALSKSSAQVAEEVLEIENEVNALEIEIDHEIASFIARRQPTAGDLRLLVAMSKTTANLERAGDEAAKIARKVTSIVNGVAPLALPFSELRVCGGLATELLRKTLDAFTRLEVQTAVSILQNDGVFDREFDGFMRKLITYMMEDPRTISASLDLIFIAKSIERIGDHSRNIAEFIIYIVEGRDVRHTFFAGIESSV
ncbi:MAG: phosphate signaling complex protein PhoU [Candidatus Nanopelagicales bacterium]|nr:phosphate signaling complex protein PhoU [Candidatus Nanopelagicales bacterium]